MYILVLNLSVSIGYHFILLFLYSSEANIVLFSPQVYSSSYFAYKTYDELI